MVTTPGARPSRRSRGRGLRALGLPSELGGVFETALTHRSYAFENPGVAHNERLEFLGDAVLGLVVADMIYTRFPDLPPGKMTTLRNALVNKKALAEVATGLGLGDHVRFGKGEELSGGRLKPRVLANALEAVLGAVFLERGFARSRTVIQRLFEERLEDEATKKERFDAKTALQEVAVRRFGERPEYRVAGTGPDHERRFLAHVFVDGAEAGSGEGGNKKEAEEMAARAALRRLEEADRDARAS